MHARQRLRLVRQAAGSRGFRRNAKRIRRRAGRQGGGYHAPQHRLRKPGGGRIDRRQRPGAHLLRVQQLEAAGRQPAAAAVEAAVHQQPLAGLQRPAELRAAERIQRGGVAVIVGDRDGRRAAAAKTERSDAHHGGAYAGVAAGRDLRQRQRPPAVLVPARRVGEQVADGAHAEPGKTFAHRGADAAQRGHVVAPGKRRAGGFGAPADYAAPAAGAVQNGELCNCATAQRTAAPPKTSTASNNAAIRLR